MKNLWVELGAGEVRQPLGAKHEAPGQRLSICRLTGLGPEGTGGQVKALAPIPPSHPDAVCPGSPRGASPGLGQSPECSRALAFTWAALIAFLGRSWPLCLLSAVQFVSFIISLFCHQAFYYIPV